MHRVMEVVRVAIDISIVPSEPNLVVVEDAATANSKHLVDDGLLKPLVFPFRHLVAIPLLVLLCHRLRSLRALVV